MKTTEQLIQESEELQIKLTTSLNDVKKLISAVKRRRMFSKKST